MAYNMNYNKMKVVLPLTLKKDEEVEKIQSSSFSGYEVKVKPQQQIKFIDENINKPLNEICHWAYKEYEKNTTKTKSKQLIKKPKKNNKGQQ